MATTVLEATVKRAVEKVLKEAGAYFIKATSDQAAGTPDLLVCYHGRFVAMELKRPGEQPTRIQAYRMAQIEQAGGYAFVVHSKQEALDALRVVAAPYAWCCGKRKG